MVLWWESKFPLLDMFEQPAIAISTTLVNYFLKEVDMEFYKKNQVSYDLVWRLTDVCIAMADYI